MKIKPPTPFAIAIDTREQHPLPFAPGIPTITGTLYPGDYSVCGHRHLLAVERKGVTCNDGVWTSDLVGTITELLYGQRGDMRRGSLRFRFELDAMRTVIRNGGVAFVATDRPRRWYAEHQYFGGLKPASLFGMIRSLEAEYGVRFEFYDSAEDLANEVVGISLEIWKHANGLKSFTMPPDAVAPGSYRKFINQTKTK